ncbi:patatin-like phospholipase family protein [Paludibacterium yongneupense]|uniref:patatin-like phospholipase family protein n=1 Tax=Paludibacterium yongneupense TaxID=400061 RepID=UPI0003F83680|nr:patatin-like phospholipase family protein [Paludibacterium yongneupense]
MTLVEGLKVDLAERAAQGDVPVSVFGPLPAQPCGQGADLNLPAGSRQVVLRRYENGVVEVELSKPPVTSLVLSGGGAKGVAYPGAISVLEQRKVMDGIRTLSGSSAGGITAALLASGMDAASFKTLSDRMNLISLLDSDRPAQRFLQNIASRLGTFFRNLLGGKVGNLAEVICNIVPRLQSDAVPLQTLIRNEMRRSVLERIAASPAAIDAGVAAIEQRLLQGGGVTFGDLDILGRSIPQIKALNITGTAMFAGRPQLALFNASSTPDMDVATAAHISGAFPIVFKQVEHRLPFMKQDAGGGEATRFQDGGVMLNVPVPELIDRPFVPGPIAEGENLILVFDGATDPVPERVGIGGAAIDWIAGAPQQAREALQAAGLKELSAQIVKVPLKCKSGDYGGMLSGTLNFTMNDAVKAELQQGLAAAVDTHLSLRQSGREHHYFKSLDDALLALDDASVSALAAACPDPEGVRAVIRFREAALAELSQLTAAIETAEARGEGTQPGTAAQPILVRLDALADTDAKRGWVVGQLNRSGNTDHARLLNLAAGWPENGSAVFRDALSCRERLDVATIAGHIRQELIFPAIYTRGQSEANIAVLRRTHYQLENAMTRQQINLALEGLASHYVARSRTDGFADLARSYVLPARSA